MRYSLDLRHLKEKEIYPLGEDFRQKNRNEEEISFTNFYMQKNGEPLFGISGEFHFSRMVPERWEDALLKMKMGGINIVATYVLWIHHEEQEGVFRFEGRYDLRRFLRLCQKHGLYVILRVGPFCHGEVRNGGIPDWMYGKPFEVRSLDEGFLSHVRRLYSRIGQQAEGLFWKDGGPVIGVQLDNEYMASSAPWEMTAGTSNEWIPGGSDGEGYILRLRALAAECGLLPAFYTGTAWGGAPAPESILPLWGGYAFQPWLFYAPPGPEEHPATNGYVYQDYHHNGVACTDDFSPSYPPESRPYACCEMGGGMTCGYRYRFRLPFKSVDAMANIRLGSGCNFLGYYMFQGGSNPVGLHGTFMNEGQVPKISYDYQAALGEFGQLRESYQRLKSLHYFLRAFGDRLCRLQTVLPEGASKIDPKDSKTLRWAVRTDGRRGFLFLNNFQDHFELPDRREEEISLQLAEETLHWQLNLAAEENAILPFHFDMDGIELVKASAQPVTRTNAGGETTYVFLLPERMQGEFDFENGVRINGEDTSRYLCGQPLQAERFTVEKGEKRLQVLVLGRAPANNLYLLSGGRLALSSAALLEDENGLWLQSGETENLVHFYPAAGLTETKQIRHTAPMLAKFFESYQISIPPRKFSAALSQTAPFRYTVSVPEAVFEGVRDVRLQISYTGDTGSAFLGGRLVHDNFYNGGIWEIGLMDFREQLEREPLILCLSPLKKGAQVRVEAAMAARLEEAQSYEAKLQEVKLQPVYEIKIG
ncbi:MAG: beta-galactosidase [Provencibacterium sp.]|jgi:hypothetical protein|nr:beta-galactosidase [Provencibacterium sp.]